MPPPITLTTLWNTPIKPELVPMMMGTLPPTGPMANSCTRVTRPATSIAFCSSTTWMAAKSSAPLVAAHRLVMIRIGVRLPTNMASTC